MRSLVALLVAAFWAHFSTVAIGQTLPTNIVYINGVQNTRVDAEATRRKIKELLRDSTNRTGTAKRSFDVTYVWNPEGFYESPVDIPNCGSPCQDIFETLVLKSSEEDYDSYFRKILAPHNASSVINIEAAKEVKKYADSLVLGTNSALSSGFITADRMAATKKAMDSLAELMRQATSSVVVAHSQGNILANLAWASAAADLGQDIRKKVRVVNVANTSRFSLNNLNLTHDDDPVLANLKVAPEVGTYNFTRNTPSCTGVCAFQLTPPTFKAPDTFSCISIILADLNFLCKHYINTYISTDDIPTVLIDQGVIFTASKTRFADRFEDFIYAAAVSLDIENSTKTRDIWTTSVYSFAPGGGGPGGGLNDDQLVVGGWADEYRSLLQFDLSAQPKVASSVKLRLYEINTHAGSNGSVSMHLDRVTSAWDWTTQPITPFSPDNQRLWWINRPTYVQMSTISAPTPGNYYEIDITALYNQWQSGAVPNFGVQLRPVLTNNYWNVFASSENATAAWRPQLNITP